MVLSLIHPRTNRLRSRRHLQPPSLPSTIYEPPGYDLQRQQSASGCLPQQKGEAPEDPRILFRVQGETGPHEFLGWLHLCEGKSENELTEKRRVTWTNTMKACE